MNIYRSYQIRSQKLTVRTYQEAGAPKGNSSSKPSVSGAMSVSFREGRGISYVGFVMKSIHIV